MTRLEFDPIKHDVLALLRARGFEHVVVEYDGMCDEGQFDIVECVPAAHQNKLQQIMPDGLAGLRAFAGVGQDAYPLKEAVTDLACACLAVRYPGWEINEGSMGTFTIDVAAGKVRLEHSVREIRCVSDDDDEM